ncbi:MAG: DNA polymerase III subunit chi [Pontixanthobacter sp.]
MRVDFYVLEGFPRERIIAGIAAKALGDGDRLLVIDSDKMQRAALSAALWELRPADFLANGDAGESRAKAQPILLSDTLEPQNGAKLLCIADGIWRESEVFDRVFYLFGDDQRQAARELWRRFSAMDSVENRYWKQIDGRWQEGP